MKTVTEPVLSADRDVQDRRAKVDERHIETAPIERDDAIVMFRHVPEGSVVVPRETANRITELEDLLIKSALEHPEDCVNEADRIIHNRAMIEAAKGE